MKKAAPKKAARQVTGVGVSCADVRRGIAKQFGEGAVFEGSSGDLALRTGRLPTGIFPLDYALAGGFPVGRITLISGHKGCLAGETLIDCPRDLVRFPQGVPLASLVGMQPHVYAWRDGRIVVARATRVWCTGARPVLRVRVAPWATGWAGRRSPYLAPLELVGTADHLVLLADGVTWRPLGALRAGDSLCSLYRRRYGSAPYYESVLRWSGSTSIVREARFILTEIHGAQPSSVHAHHRNACSLDQSVENLAWVDGGLHVGTHLAQRNRMGTAGWKVSGRHPKGMGGKAHSPEKRAQIAASMRRAHAEGSHPGFNHRVLSVESGGVVPVFDMTVPGADSFVANGVVVHNSGKTTTTLLAIAEWMRRHPGKQRAAWHDVEGVFDPDWAKAAGVDLDRLEVTRPKSAEEAADIFCGFLSAREVEVHALDSIAQLAPAVILESSAFDQQRGELPRLMNKFVTRISALVNAWSQQRKPRTVFLLNQLRQKITGFGNAVPMVEPGGMGQVFGASLVLRCRRIKYLFESDSDAERGIGPLYALNFFKVEQSKVSPPHLEGEYKLGLRSVELAPEGDEPRLVARRARPDTIDAFLLRARESEFLTATDGKFWSFGVRDPEGLYITAPTRAKLEALVRDNPWIWQAFSDRLIERAYDFGGE